MTLKINVKYLGGIADGINLTGSCIFVEIIRGKKVSKILIDVGLLQCDFKNSIKRNKQILKHICPSKIDYIITTHSHIDHSGRIPFMAKNGFKGKIFVTKSSNSLLKVMLPDSANIQESEAEYLNRKKRKANTGNNTRKHKQKREKDKNKERRRKGIKHSTGIEPLYTMTDVKKSYGLIKNSGFNYNEWIKINLGISLKFYPSGHVLGGAICVLRIMKQKSKKNVFLGFSGDLGREDGIILPPPETINEPIDYWFIESTYGDKIHPQRDAEIIKLNKLVNEVGLEKKIMIIPSFALERVQEIIYLLSYHMHAKNIATVPIYLDSPLAHQITKIFSKYWHTKMFKDQDMLPFNPFEVSKNPYLKVTVSQEESTKLTKLHAPFIVIAGSGMCDAGRVRNHLRQNLKSNKTVICLIGFMSDNSLGKKLKDGYPLVKMNGKEITVNAKIVFFESFSAHADSSFLTSYTQTVMNKPGIYEQKIFIGHGSVIGGLSLKKKLIETLPGSTWKKRIIIPKLNQKIVLI